MSTTLPPTSPPGALRVGRWRVDAAADEIVDDSGRATKLEPQQMRLLLVLAASPGQVIGVQALLDRVWPGLVVTQNSVYQAVAQLRRQLGEPADGPAYIQTVHRKGYRLLAPVARLAATEPPLAAPVAAPVADIPVAPPVAPAAGNCSSLPTTAAPAQRAPRRRLLIGGAVAGGTAALAGVAAVAWWGSAALRQPPPDGSVPAAAPRLVVLPFADLSADQSEQAMARGLALDLHHALGRHTGLTVIAFEAALELERAGAATPAAAAQRLAARYVLGGEIRRDGSVLKVRALLHALTASTPSTSQKPIWQQDFEHPAARAAALPEAIARAVTSALGLAPIPPAPPRSDASEAFELFVLGSNALRTKTAESYAKARAYHQRGIDLDPNYARNYIGLANAWIGAAAIGAGVDLPRAIARATPLLDTALRLDPEAPDALTAQALLHNFAGEHDAARRLLQRALAVYPNHGQALFALALVELETGWPLRAALLFERTAALNPLSTSPLDRLSQTQAMAGRTDAGAATARRCIALQPAVADGAWLLGINAYATGEQAAAVAAYRQALAIDERRPFLWHELAWLYLDLGLVDEAAAAFARAVAQLPGTPWLPVFATFAWVARAAPGPPPPSLATDRAPTDGSAVELLLARLMGGLDVDTGLLAHLLDATAARGESLTSSPWLLFKGWNRLLNLATLHIALGHGALGSQRLLEAERQLAQLQAQGNRGHALHFHQARLLALQGRGKPALDALEAAVKAGSRRAWWLRKDPAFAPLRAERRFVVLLADIDSHRARQLQQVGRGGGVLKKS